MLRALLTIQLVSHSIGWAASIHPIAAVRQPPFSCSPVFGRDPSRTWGTMSCGITSVPDFAMMRRDRDERLLRFGRWPIDRHKSIRRQRKRRATHSDR